MDNEYHDQYWRDLLVWNADGSPNRKLTLTEAQAIYPQRNPLTLDRDTRRAWARLGKDADKLAGDDPDGPRRENDVTWAQGKISNHTNKFVGLFDLHYPYQVHQPAIEKFLKDFRPDILVYGGDALNMDPFNHWAMKVPRQTRSLPNPKDYYDAANRELFQPIRKAIPKRCMVVYMMGNHEEWATRAIDDEPRGEGYWEPELNIEGVDLWVKPRGMVNIGKLHFIHGDGVVPSGGGTNPARNFFLRGYHRNVVAGHLHTYSVATEVSPVDNEDRHVAEFVPCLTQFDPPFMAHRPHQWCNGFIYGYVEPNGMFHKHTVIISGGKFVAEGVLYE